MPIVFAAITPHPPLIIPSIGGESVKKLKKTERAFKKLEQDLYASQPECVIILSPHGKILPDAFLIDFYPEYVGGFEEFGDHSMKCTAKSDVQTIQEIRSSAQYNKEVPVVFSSDPKIDYGISIPLIFLSAHLKNVPIVPIHPSGLSISDHCLFGYFLKRQLHHLNKRFALIASGDLAHGLTKNVSSGYSRKSVAFNKKIIECVKKRDIEEFMKLDEKQIQEISMCCHKVFTMLFCAMRDSNYTIEFLSYENPFGVGYLTAELMFD